MRLRTSSELDPAPRVDAKAEFGRLQRTRWERTAVLAVSALINAAGLWAINPTIVAPRQQGNVVFASIQLNPSREPEPSSGGRLLRNTNAATQPGSRKVDRQTRGTASRESPRTAASEPVAREKAAVGGGAIVPEPVQHDSALGDLREQAKRAAKDLDRETDPRDRFLQDRTSEGSIARLGKEVEAAARERCATRYASAGLLAPLLWAIDSKPGVGCRWGD